MEHAYDIIYLENARRVLARTLDHAVNDLKIDLSMFFNMFVISELSRRFERGEFEIVAGMSGVELARRVVEESGLNLEIMEPSYSLERSPQYWAGWAIAYYQWKNCLSFAEIERRISAAVIISLYEPYHEMDIRQFCDKMDVLYLQSRTNVNLKEIRQNAGISQSQLAKGSGVPVRTIQQYEQKQKDINKANGEYLIKMARCLGCEVSDLIEKVN